MLNIFRHTQFQSHISDSKTHQSLASRSKLHLVVKSGTTDFHINYEPQKMMTYCRKRHLKET
jgi:hypothetical protein